MRISSQDVFMGQPILNIRKLLRYTGGSSFNYDSMVRIVMDILQVDQSKAKQIILALQEEGFIEKTSIGKSQEWVNTLKGNSLSLASAAKPISRKTAEKKLQEFLERVKQVNGNEYYLFKVKKVLLFGSYLGNDEHLGDIDIAVEIVPKEQDQDKHFKLTQQRAREAREQGRNFRNFVEELFWAREEVKKFLKSRTRSLSLHETDDRILEQVNYKVLFDE